MEHCHFVLDDDLTWDSFKRDYPLAFCIGCTPGTMRDLTKLFQSQGFSAIQWSDQLDNTAFIARNDKFKEVFEAAIGLVE